MVVKKIVLLSCVALTLANATQVIPFPPAIPMLETNKKVDTNITEKSSMPKECTMIPPMMILLPPPMEIELTNCKNQLNLPNQEFAQKQLSTFLKKEVKVQTIEIVQGFSEVYKITYSGGVIFTNKSVTQFLP